MAYFESNPVVTLTTPELVALSQAEVVVESGEQIVRDMLSTSIQKLHTDDLVKVAQFMHAEGLDG